MRNVTRERKDKTSVFYCVHLQQYNQIWCDIFNTTNPTLLRAIVSYLGTFDNSIDLGRLLIAQKLNSEIEE